MDNLRHLLVTWNLEIILPHLIDQEIDIDTLTIMKISHIKSLLYDFPLGIQIRFEHYLEQWRYKIDKPLKYTKGNHSDTNEITSKQTPNQTTITPSPETTSKDATITQEPEISKINLKEILLQSQPEGQELLNIYRENQTFSNSEYNRLIDVIVKYYLKNQLKLDLNISYELENAIMLQFPTESYRTSIFGKIYTKYIMAKTGFSNGNDLRDQKNNFRNGEGSAISGNEQQNKTSDLVKDQCENLLISSVSGTENKGIPTEILLQTSYNNSKKFLRVCEPFLSDDFISLACSSFNIDHKSDMYVAINDCEISPDDFKDVILQYYKLPTFHVDLKQRVYETKLEIMDNSCSTGELATQSNICSPVKTFNTSNHNAAIQILDHLPSASDIRNIPSLWPMVKISDDGRPLENKHRTAIAKAIIDECLQFQPDRVLRRQDFFTLTEQLVLAFPNEKDSTYYVGSQANHPARGKLWNAYNNKRCILGKSGLVQRRQHINHLKRKFNSDVDDGSEITTDKIYLSGTVIESKDFGLETTLDWNTLQQKWSDCHQQRMRELLRDKITPDHYMNKYSILKSNRGIDLMELDVNILHPTVVSINNWLSLHEKVIEMGRKLVKGDQMCRIVANIDSSKDEKYRASLALMILPHIFPYNARRNEFNEKASKYEMQARFIKEYESLEDLKSDIEYPDLQMRFVHCNQQINYAEFKICGHIFKCIDLLVALSSIFHYTVALNMDYPKLSLHIWQFIQLAIFQIEIQGCKEPNVESTINDLYMI